MTRPSYEKTIQELYSYLRLGIKPGLKCIRSLLSALGNPEDSFPAVHVAGTNGKGSTSAMIEAVLTEAGVLTGLFTSPHLVRFNERIRVAGKDISDNDVVNVYKEVKSAAARIGVKPTFFELTTAMAMAHFRNKKVELAILETGMGGRLDATNAATPLVAVITNIGKDHTAHLGSTLTSIAGEKAGIIRSSVPVVTAEGKPSALEIIKRRASKKRAPLFRLGADFFAEPVASKRSYAFDYLGIFREIKNLKTNLRGRFQTKNAAVAVAAVELLSAGSDFKVSTAALRKGLKNVRWPGRLEVVGQRGVRHRGKPWPLVLLDSAHNKEAAVSLASELASLSTPRLILVLGILGDKDVRGFCSTLAPLADAFVLTEPKNPRAASADTISGLVAPGGRPAIIRRSVAEACAAAIELAGPGDAVCVTGSVFTVGEAKEYFAKAAPRP